MLDAGETDTGIRLIPEGNINAFGIIEVSIRGEWRSVCDNGWSDEDARVACRALGLQFIGEVKTIFYIHLFRGF